MGKHNPYNYEQDGHIWESIKKLREVEDEEEFNKQKRLLISYLSLLLKEDWERSKNEIRGIDKSKIVHGMALIFLSGYVYFLVSILKIENLKVVITIIFISGIAYGATFCIAKVLLEFSKGYDSFDFKKIMKEKYLRWSKYVVCWGVIILYFWSVTYLKELVTEQIMSKKILEQVWVFDIIHFTFGVFLCYSAIAHISSIEKVIERTKLIEQEKDKHMDLYKEHISDSLHIIDKIILCINNGTFKESLEQYKGFLLRNLDQLIRVVNRRIYERGYNIYEIERIDAFIQQQEVVKQIKICMKEVKLIESNNRDSTMVDTIKERLCMLQEHRFGE